MAVGDLVTADGMYEFNGVGFNDHTSVYGLRVEKVEGLWSMDMRSDDLSAQVGPGGFPGRDFVASKDIIIDFWIDQPDVATYHQSLRALKDAIQPLTTDVPFVFQKAGLTPYSSGKFCIMARPRRIAVATDFSETVGWRKGVLALKAIDSRIYALSVKTNSTTIAAGVSAGTPLVCNNAGTFLGDQIRGGSLPVLQMDGPFTNPRISNGVDGRVTALDLTVPAGKTLTVDVYRKTASLSDGTDVFSTVRLDNQWWKLYPGNNTIQFNRSDTGALVNCRVIYQDAWV